MIINKLWINFLGYILEKLKRAIKSLAWKIRKCYMENGMSKANLDFIFSNLFFLIFSEKNTRKINLNIFMLQEPIILLINYMFLHKLSYDMPNISLKYNSFFKITRQYAMLNIHTSNEYRSLYFAL